MRSGTRSGYEERVRRVIDLIVERLDEPLDAVALADAACFSRYHFHRIFKGMVGESIGEFQRRLLLERAAHHLAFGSQTVAEIALDAGFLAPEAFARAFRTAFGVSPSQFRARSALPRRLASPNSIHYPVGVRPITLPLRQEDTMQLTVQNIPAMRLAAMRHVGPYDQIGPTFGRLWAWVGRHQVPAQGSVAIYHDNPEITPAAELRSDAGVVLPAGYEPPGDEVQVVEVPAGSYAVYRHEGPYDQLGSAWTRFMGEWLPGSDYEITDGVCFELYVSDPSTTPPDRLITDLYEPVRAR